MMIDKKQQLLEFLQNELFTPVICSPYVSVQVKHDFEHMLQTLKGFSAEGILYYIWNTLASHDVDMVFSHRLTDEGFNNYEEILDTFKHEFTYDWLIS